MLPLAISPAGWTAIGAIGGALVGSTAGGIVDWLLGIRREKALAKAGARLIAGEIAAAESQLAAAQHSGKWRAFYGMPIDSWAEYRDILAVRLSQPQFDADGFVSINPEKIEPIRREAATAFNALAELAGHDREGDLIRRPGDD
jgi:hypothetical protein